MASLIFDIGKNDDALIITLRSTMEKSFHNELRLEESDNYYSHLVQISIPRSLKPLPTSLLDNSMNILVSYIQTSFILKFGTLTA